MELDKEKKGKNKMQKSYLTTLHSALWTLKGLGNCVKY